MYDLRELGSARGMVPLYCLKWAPIQTLRLLWTLSTAQACGPEPSGNMDFENWLYLATKFINTEGREQIVELGRQPGV
jgi:hypothetical protein